MTSYSQMTPEQLLAQRTLIDTEIANRGVSGPTGGKQKKEKKEKKEKRRSQGTAWADFGKKVIQDNSADYETFKSSLDKKQGVMPLFVSQYRTAHEAEWVSFQTAWNETHPKLGKLPKETKCEIVSSAEQSEAEDASVAESKPEKPEGKRRGPKKLADMTPEELASHNTKKEAKAKERKAKKEAEATTTVAAAVAEAPVAPVPVPAPVTVPTPAPVTTTTVAQKDDEVAEFRIFKMDGQDYMRIFNKDDNDWASTDLWYSKDGKRATYFGELMDDGSVNTDAEEPELE
jgi:hypothetical protein